MTTTIRRGVLAGLVLGSLVLVTGCGGSKGVDPKPAPANPDIPRVGIGTNTGGKDAPPDKGGKLGTSASTN
jgi:hypothetical protein